MTCCSNWAQGDSWMHHKKTKMNATDSDVIELVYPGDNPSRVCTRGRMAGLPPWFLRHPVLEIRELALKEAGAVYRRMIWGASIFGTLLKRL